MRSSIQGRIQAARRRNEATYIIEPIGVWGQETRGETPHRDPHRPPDLGSQLPNLDPGIRSDKSWSRRGEAEGGGAAEDCCKGTEQPEGAARLDRADLRRGRLRGARGCFSVRFPPSRRGLRSVTSLYIHTRRRWGSIGSRGTSADRGRQGGATVRDLKG